MAVNARDSLLVEGFDMSCTTRRRDGHCLVVCSCGHESIGDFFDSVRSHNPKDAWWRHKLHVDAKHTVPEVKPSDYLGMRADELGRPPAPNYTTNMEYAPPGTCKYARDAYKLIRDLVAALVEAERAR